MVEPKRSAPSPESPPSSANKKKNASSSSSAPVVLLLLLLVLASSPSANEAFSSSYSSYSCPASSSRRRRRPSRRPHDGGFASLSSPPPANHPRHLASSLAEPPPPLRAGGESSSSSSACVVDDDDDDDGAAVRLPSTTTTTPPPGRRKSRQHRRRLSADSVINTSILLSVILVVLEQVLSVDVGITRGWSAIETANRVPLDNWRAYSHVLHSSPVATKAITSGAVYAIGDVLSQRSSSSLPGAGYDMGDLDRGRVLRSLVAGFVGHGPMSHVWYHVSEAFFDDVIKMQHVWYDFVPKVILDQAIFGPIWNNSYILLLGVMQLHRPGRIWDDMKRTTLPLILKGLKLWPFVHVITYGLIPVENRLLWVDAVEIVWVTILASTASSSPPPPGEEEEEEEKEDKI